MKIRLLPEAERDLEIAADFYESQRSGLGSFFNDCLTADIESLKIYAGSMKPTVASSDPFRSVSRSRYTTCLPTIVSTSTRFSTQGKTQKL